MLVSVTNDDDILVIRSEEVVFYTHYGGRLYS